LLAQLRAELTRTLASVWQRRPADWVTLESFIASIEKWLLMAIPELRLAGTELWKALGLPMEPKEEFRLAMLEETWRRDASNLPTFTIADCGDMAPLLAFEPDESAPAPVFQIPADTFVPRLPAGITLGQEVEVTDELALRTVVIVLQLKWSQSAPTTEWSTVRREFTPESAREYVRELAIAEIETKRRDIAARWSASQHERHRAVQRAYILARTDDQLRQEDFDFTSYLGRGQRVSRKSEMVQVYLDWVRTPKQLEFAARMKRLDKDRESEWVPGQRIRYLILQRHAWATDGVIAWIWPSIGAAKAAQQPKAKKAKRAKTERRKWR
jgi:hypothetical protein